MQPEPKACPAAGAQHSVRIAQTGESYPCFESETLLQGMARIGRKGIPVGCSSGGCGVCKVSVRVGTVRTVGPMSRAHVSAEEEARGIFLACRVAPVDSIEVDVVGKLRKALSFQWNGDLAKGGPQGPGVQQTKGT